jgi:glycosyltransferase involved in cell wall biosynthesis
MFTEHKPKVSVIIPTYNRANYVTFAVESVLQQSMQDYEIIVVDDGSTDDTPERLKQFGSRIIYIHTHNQGKAPALNIGMRIAQGQYIAYLDSDDVYTDFKLEIQVGLLEHYPDVGFVYTEFSAFDDALYFDEWHLQNYHSSAYKRGITYENLFSEKVPFSDTPFAVKALGDSHPEWMNRYVYFGHIFDACLFNTVVFTNSIMFRRSLLPDIGSQDPQFTLFNDLEFVLRICRKHPAAFMDIPTYKLRYHPDQISTTEGARGRDNNIKKQRELLQIFRVHGLRDEEYYQQHARAVDKQLARLYRAVAIPLLSYGTGSPYQNKYYPKRARKYLGKCARPGKKQCFLWSLSFLPHYLRRLGFAIFSIRQRLRGIVQKNKFFKA